MKRDKGKRPYQKKQIPQPFETSLTRAIERLDRINPVNFSDEDLRVTIGQKHRLVEVMPVAIERLQCYPLAEGYAYPGDVLHAVLRVPEAYWLAYPKQRIAILDILETLDFGDRYQVPDLLKAIGKWRNT